MKIEKKGTKMQIILKLTIPDNTIKEIDELATELWPKNYCWWDVVWGAIKQLRVIGEPEFVGVVYKKRWWRRLRGRKKI